MPVASAASAVISPSGLAGRHQVGQHGRVHRHGLPFPVPAGRPVQALVVEGHVAHLAADRIDEAAGQAVGQVAGEEQVLVGLCPDLGLVGADPVGLGLGLQIGDGLGHARPGGRPSPTARRPASSPRCGAGRARRWPGAAAGRCASRLITVARWVVRATPAIGVPHRHSPAPADRWQAWQTACQNTSGSCSARPGAVEKYGSIGTRALASRLPAQVEQQGAHALGAVIDGENEVLFHLRFRIVSN